MLGLFFGSTSTWAAPPAGRVELSWAQQEPTCITAAALAATVERTLDQPVFQGDGAAVATVTGSIGKADADRFVARIALDRARPPTALVRRRSWWAWRWGQACRRRCCRVSRRARSCVARSTHPASCRSG